MLCIDQGDDFAKTQQIRLITVIYSRAIKVVAWVGLGDRVGLGDGLYKRLHATLQELADFRKRSDRSWNTLTTVLWYVAPKRLGLIL